MQAERQTQRPVSLAAFLKTRFAPQGKLDVTRTVCDQKQKATALVSETSVNL